MNLTDLNVNEGDGGSREEVLEDDVALGGPEDPREDPDLRLRRLEDAAEAEDADVLEDEALVVVVDVLDLHRELLDVREADVRDVLQPPVDRERPGSV